MKLSVCCLTADRPAMVAAILAEYRAVADEILVAVDSRVRPDALGPLHEVADRVVRFEYGGTPEEARPWLVNQCIHPLVLMVDGDEVPSHALLSALPELAREPAERRFKIARRWVFPTVDTWLDERPWWPDFQRRLVLRDADLDFDLRYHGGIREDRPEQIVMAPIYHLVAVTRTFAERRGAARRYSAARPGLQAVGGGDMNETLYVPEHFATRPPAATPAEDVAVLYRVLEATDGAPTDDVPPVVTTDEIRAHAQRDPLEPGGYRVRLEMIESDFRTDPGFTTTVVLRITNEGDVTIPFADGPGVQVRACARVLDRRPGAPLLSASRTPLLGDIPPGSERHVECVVDVPGTPGIYTVEFDLVNERSRWFDCVHTADLLVATRWGRFEFEQWERPRPGDPTVRSGHGRLAH